MGLGNVDIYENDPLLKEYICFCYFPLIRKDLNPITNNQNVISKSRNQGPQKRQNTIFYIPHLFESPTYGTVTDSTNLNDLYASTVANVSKEYQELAREVLRGT